MQLPYSEELKTIILPVYQPAKSCGFHNWITICITKGYTFDELKAMRAQKADKRGNLRRGYF